MFVKKNETKRQAYRAARTAEAARPRANEGRRPYVRPERLDFAGESRYMWVCVKVAPGLQKGPRFMPLPRHKVAAYDRARRARLKAEAKANGAPSPAIPLGRALTAKERRDDAEMERIEARGGRPEWDNAQGRWRDAPHAPSPRSMVAIGGKPGTGRPIPGYDPTFAPHDGYAVSHQVNTVIMLSALAARSDTLERRVATLEATAANRKAETLDLAQMIVGLARAAFIGGR